MNENATLYDVLDLKPDASQQEVREAYVRTKSAYNKDSLALYTLISTQEREEILGQIEEAYEVLSNPEKRKEYDRCHGLMSSDAEYFSKSRAPNKKIISIDRVPPMESLPDSERLLVAPATDFAPADRPAAAQQDVETFSSPGLPSSQGSAAAAFVAHATPQKAPAVPAPTLVQPPAPAQSPEAPAAPAAPVETGIAYEITVETEWTGPFLKRVRDFRKVSIEEMASITKISKTYITAIEAEDFKKLPAPVFVRGFVMQVARVLRLPAEQVATPFMARYNKSRGND
jgi:hypothetical protein